MTVVLQEAERTDLPVRAIHRSADALLLEILARLGGHGFRPDASDSLRQIAASAAEQALPFDTVVHSVRDSHRMWLEQLLSRMRLQLLPEQALAEVPLVVTEVIDDAITQIVGAIWPNGNASPRDGRPGSAPPSRPCSTADPSIATVSSGTSVSLSRTTTSGPCCGGPAGRPGHC
ncbi:hypothetical protein [Streptomyces sp. NPDC048612]|uniref:hypothetical protein n=1 Tax=Streptomyces sp. NPDC048612 TaxID=3365579 RepID=UPI00372366B5